MSNEICTSCTHWVLQRKRVYEDGSENIYFQASAGMGYCEELNVETKPDFGCIKFALNHGNQIRSDVIPGLPWQHFRMDKCPDCNGRGCGKDGGACRRCAGTGQVRYYEDGYVGEERTRHHPKEPEKPIAVDAGTMLKPVPKVDVLASDTGPALEPLPQATTP